MDEGRTLFVDWANIYNAKGLTPPAVDSKFKRYII
jgi:hypothetical protein